MAEHPEQHIEDDQRPRVADMSEVVDRRSAHVHADIPRIEGDEILLRSAQRVVEPKSHSPIPRHERSYPAGRGDRLVLLEGRRDDGLSQRGR